MNVAQFLQWLYEQISKVIDWFSASYWALRNAAASAWDWAQNAASTAYSDAVTWALVAVNNLSAYLRELIQDGYDRAHQLVTDLRNDVIGWINNQIGNLNTAIDWLNGKITDARTAAYGWVIDAYTASKAFAEGLVTTASNTLKGLIGPLLALNPFISFLVMLGQPDNQSKLTHFLGEAYQNIISFLNNPLGFILNLLMTRLKEFLEYYLAYALGKDDDGLPPPPDWNQ